MRTLSHHNHLSGYDPAHMTMATSMSSSPPSAVVPRNPPYGDEDMEVLRKTLKILYAFLTVMQALPETALSLVLSREMGVSPNALVTFYTITFIPWSFKPVYGLIADSLPIYGKRRKPYVLLCSFASAISFMTMALFVDTLLTFTVIATVNATMIAFAELMVDSLAVERGNKDKEAVAGRSRVKLPCPLDPIQSEYVPLETEPGEAVHPLSPSSSSTSSSSSWGSSETVIATSQSEYLVMRTVGTLLATAASIGLLVLVNPRAVLLMSGAFALAVFGTTWKMLPEQSIEAINGLHAEKANPRAAGGGKPTDSDRDTFWMQHSLQPVSRFCLLVYRLLGCLLMMLRPALFLFVLSAVPSTADATSLYVIDNFTFPDWQIAAFSLVSCFGAFIGAVFYYYQLTTRPMAAVFVLASVLNLCVDGASDWMLANKVFPVSVDFFMVLRNFLIGFMGSVSLLPVIVLSASSCPSSLHMEATMYALFTSVRHVGSLFSSAITVLFQRAYALRKDDWAGLSTFTLTVNALGLAPVLLVPLLLEGAPAPAHAGGKGRVEERVHGALDEEVAVCPGQGDPTDVWGYGLLGRAQTQMFPK